MAEDGPSQTQGGRQGRSEDGAGARQEAAGGSSTKPQEMEFMMLMLQSMQELQRKISEDKESRDGMEVVRTGAPDLPVLADWSPGEGPIAMGDWLTMLEPAIADLSESSEEWWSQLMTAVKTWYAEHVLLSPLERTAHRPVPPAQLQQRKWQRLERRVASMLLKAVPEAQKEELVAGKNLSAFAIMAHLQILYQPGGLGEKEMVLRNLESPPEAGNLQEAVIQLRRWMRWRIRARDIGVAEPDPSVLVRGLGRVVKKILDIHPDLRFRVSLAKSTLMLDSAPSSQSVDRYVTLLLAETELIAHTDKKVVNPKPKLNEAKLAKEEKGEAEKGKGKGKSVDQKGVCHYFLTDEGCRRGKDCTFAHNLDQEKRCWACGSKSHLSNACPRGGGEGSKEGGKKALKAVKSGEWDRDPKTSSPGKTAGSDKGSECGDPQGGASSMTPPMPSSGSSDDGMKGLLEEAHRMLKSMSVGHSQTAESKEEGKLSALQKQLDELKNVRLRVFRLSRLQKQGGQWGLLDSGATHPLRPPIQGEDLRLLPEVTVVLAGGQEVGMKFGKGGSIVGEESTEPIVPMGLLTNVLKCKMVWSCDGVKLQHPIRGNIDVQVVDGCPMVPYNVALSLIKEIEEAQWGRINLAQLKARDLSWKKTWIRRIAEEHPAFQGIPEKIKEALIEDPCEYMKPFGNRRRRISSGSETVWSCTCTPGRRTATP